MEVLAEVACMHACIQHPAQWRLVPANKPHIRYHTPLEFPLLDSFPNIVSQVSNPSRSVAIHSSLSTDRMISSRLQDLQKLVCKMISVEERESLSNGLGDLCEAYAEGWDSGSDNEIDD